MGAILSIKDMKILRELEHDARQSFGEIGRKTGMSKEVVLYRVRNLEKQGIIRGYLAEIDLYRLGFRLYPALFRFEEMSEQQEGEMGKYLKRAGHVGWAARCEGGWDLNAVLRVRNAREIAEFFDDFEARFGRFILDKALMHTVSLSYFKRNFNLGEDARKIIRTEEADAGANLPEKEELLLRAISGDARKPVQGLADAAGVSPPTAMAIIKRLERQGIIQGYRVFTGFQERGHLYYKLWLNLKHMEKEGWDSLYAFLSFEPHVLWAARTVGHYDFSVELEVPGIEALRSFVARLKGRFHGSIRKRDTLLVSEEVAISYFPTDI